MEPAEEPKRLDWRKLALKLLKSGIIGAGLGALCGVLPEHLNVARVVCRFVALLVSGGP